MQVQQNDHSDFYKSLNQHNEMLLAIGYQRLDVVEKLLEEGLDLEFIANEEGPTLLKVACDAKAYLPSHWPLPNRIIKLLLDAGADPNKDGARDKVTPLITAAFNNNVDAVEMLLDAGANPDYVSGIGIAAIHHAAYMNYAIMRLLIDHGANPNLPNGSGETPLHLVLQSVNEKGNCWPEHKILLLLKHGCVPSKLDLLNKSKKELAFIDEMLLKDRQAFKPGMSAKSGQGL